MGKLKAMPSLLSPMPSRLGAPLPTEEARDKYRAKTQPWRAWYKTPRWRAARMACFVRDGFTCQRCGRLEGDTSKLVCNHRKPHRGDARLFWDEDNHMTACKPCHDGPIQAEELAAERGGGLTGTYRGAG